MAVLGTSQRGSGEDFHSAGARLPPESGREAAIPFPPSLRLQRGMGSCTTPRPSGSSSAQGQKGLQSRDTHQQQNEIKKVVLLCFCGFVVFVFLQKEAQWDTAGRSSIRLQSCSL